MRKPLLLLALLMIGQAAHAQFVRFLPQAGELGRTGATLPMPDVQINREIVRLAPGAVIFDQQNRTVVHASLPPGAIVFFTRDQSGYVQRMYLLTDDEARRLIANPPPKVLVPGAPAVVR